MGLDIDLTKDGEEINEMNWLRNPFGLEPWVRDNIDDSKRTHVFSAKVWKDNESREVLIDWDQEMDWNLRDVINLFCYDGEKLLNEGDIKQRTALRRLFKAVVDSYWEILKDLDEGYFYFDLPSYRQFVEGKGFPNIIKGAKYGENRLGIKSLMIPMSDYHQIRTDRVEYGHVCLEDYQKWFRELVAFANDLQDLDNKFYGSN